MHENAKRYLDQCPQSVRDRVARKAGGMLTDLELHGLIGEALWGDVDEKARPSPETVMAKVIALAQREHVDSLREAAWRVLVEVTRNAPPTTIAEEREQIARLVEKWPSPIKGDGQRELAATIRARGNG